MKWIASNIACVEARCSFDWCVRLCALRVSEYLQICVNLLSDTFDCGVFIWFCISLHSRYCWHKLTQNIENWLRHLFPFFVNQLKRTRNFGPFNSVKSECVARDSLSSPWLHSEEKFIRFHSNRIRNHTILFVLIAGNWLWKCCNHICTSASDEMGVWPLDRTLACCCLRCVPLFQLYWYGECVAWHMGAAGHPFHARWTACVDRITLNQNWAIPN